MEVSLPEDAIQQALSMWASHERRRAEILASVDIAEASLARWEGRVITQGRCAGLPTLLDNVAVPALPLSLETADRFVESLTKRFADSCRTGVEYHR